MRHTGHRGNVKHNWNGNQRGWDRKNIWRNTGQEFSIKQLRFKHINQEPLDKYQKQNKKA